MTIKLLTEYYLVLLNLKGGYTDSSESTLVKSPHCWKSHVMAHMVNVLKFPSLNTCQKGLDKQGRPRSDCFWWSSLIRDSLFAILTSILQISALKTNILFENRKRKMFGISEHLRYWYFYTKNLSFRIFLLLTLCCDGDYSVILPNLVTYGEEMLFYHRTSDGIGEPAHSGQI